MCAWSPDDRTIGVTMVAGPGDAVLGYRRAQPGLPEVKSSVVPGIERQRVNCCVKVERAVDGWESVRPARHASG